MHFKALEEHCQTEPHADHRHGVWDVHIPQFSSTGVLAPPRIMTKQRDVYRQTAGVNRHGTHIAGRVLPQFTWHGRANNWPTVKGINRECTAGTRVTEGSFPRRSGIPGTAWVKTARCWVTSCFRTLTRSGMVSFSGPSSLLRIF